MAVSALELVGFIREMLSNDEKLKKFKEIAATIKSLIADIKDIVSFIKG